jgi:hypothetical protein
VSERDDSRHLAIGGGIPADPDPLAAGPAAAAVADGGPASAVDLGVTPCPYLGLPSSAEAVQAVADFVADLVEDVDPGDADGDADGEGR